MTTISFTTDSFFQDPYPTYQIMRELKGAYWLEHQDHTGSGGMWMFSRYSDVVAILRNTSEVSVDTKRLIPETDWTAFDYTLLHTDPPDHGRLRALLSPPFSNDGVRKLEASITRIVDHLIDNMINETEVEFLQAFALPLPFSVICELMGAPLADAEQLRIWTVDFLAGLDSALANDELHEKRSAALIEVSEYFTHLLNRPHQPEGTIISQLAANKAATNCSPQEALAQCLLLMLAGHETTVNMLGNGLFTLLSNPTELEKLRANPELIDRAIDEILRFETPFQRTSFRVVTAPLQIGKQEVQPGQCISAIFSAANRDPQQFSEPDRFDITRKPNRHVSFGAGIHRCLGEKLARAEARIAFTRILQRLPSIQLASARPRWQCRSLFRALETLPLRLG